MADGFYPGDNAEGDTGNTPAPDKTSTDKPAEDDSETFLTPKSAFGDVKVGDTQSFEVVHIYEDEIEWKPADTETPKEEMSAAEEMDNADKMGMSGKMGMASAANK